MVQKICSVPRLHDSCGTDLGWSIIMATDHIYSICVFNPRLKGPTFQLPAIAVQSIGETFKNLNLHIETNDQRPSQVERS